jgi:hypothetical protein
MHRDLSPVTESYETHMSDCMPQEVTHVQGENVKKDLGFGNDSDKL